MDNDNTNVPQSEPQSEVIEEAGFDIVTPDIPLPQEEKKNEVEDLRPMAFRFSFIGSGQGGSRLASTFYQLGYRRVCAINTAEQDMTAIKLPNESKMLIGSGGAGKQPHVAAQLYAERKEDVLDFMRRSFGQVFDRIIVTAGAGGGTGAGTLGPLVETAAELQVALKCSSRQVGVILALPKLSEGKKVSANAFLTLTDMLDRVEVGQVSPLIVLDNERISTIHPGLAVNPFWDTANSSVCSLFNLFNSICVQPSSFTSFDASDLKTVLDSGLIVFGATPVQKWSDATDVSFAVRNNLQKNILSGGVDLKTGSTAGVVIIGGRSVMDSIPQENLDHAFEQLTRLLQPGSTVHRGIYSGSKETLNVYTMIGGLSRPSAKLDELQRHGDVTFSRKPPGVVLGEASLEQLRERTIK